MLAQAMQQEASLLTFIEGKQLLRRLRTYLAAEMHATLAGGGAVDIVRDTAGVVIAAAVWEQPGYRAPLLQTLRHGPSMLEAARWKGLRNWIALRPEFLRFRPQAPHWHLVRLATDARFRRRGLGTTLLQHRLAKVDAARDIAHLEASSHDSTRLYRRLGFAATGEIRLLADNRVLVMTRPRGGAAAAIQRG